MIFPDDLLLIFGISLLALGVAMFMWGLHLI